MRDPVGPETDVWLTTMALRAAAVIVGWGAHPAARRREEDVLDVLGSGVMCLGRTKDGSPRHPLYLQKETRPKPYYRPGRGGG